MTVVLLFILLVTSGVHSKLHVLITAPRNANKSDIHISYSGFNRHDTSEADRRLVNLTEALFRNAIDTGFGTRPSDELMFHYIAYKFPYDIVSWKKSARIIKAKAARIIYLKSDQVVLSKHHYKRNNSKRQYISASFANTVKDTISSNWTMNEELIVPESLQYKIDMSNVPLAGKSEILYLAEWGRNGDVYLENKTAILPCNMSIVMPMEPYQKLTAEIGATRVIMKIEIDYKATITGFATLAHHNEKVGPIVRDVSVKDVLDYWKLNDSFISTHVIELKYHFDPVAVIKVFKENKTLYKIPLMY